MTDDVKPISPELALVDPEFARFARASLPAPPDCLAARLPPLASPPRDYSTPATSRRATEIERRHDGQLRRAVAAAGWVLVAGVVASPLLAFMPQRSAPLIIEAPSPARPVARAATNEERTSVISWPKVPAATFYNLILVHGTERVDLWPTEPNARIEPVEPSDSATSLFVYDWFVYPAFRRPSGKVRYGVVTARGSIAIRGSLRTRIHRKEPVGG